MNTNRVSCFIRKNTKEIRERLEGLGYKLFCPPIEILDVSYSKYASIETIPQSNVYILRIEEYIKYSNVIDCGTNEELFFALAALRDDTDYMQWFEVETPLFEFEKTDAYEARMILCTEHSIDSFAENIGINIVCWRKATTDEIVEHFKI